MLRGHFKAVEEAILAQSKIPANTGHTLHRGTPRESFIKEFLENHLSEKLGIGTGEIIDSNSFPRDQRNQVDIVVYRKEYPKLSFGGGISGFLAESVVATIEVKSLLDYAGILQSVKTANTIKKLKRNMITAFSTGRQAPGILSFIVAYDGPKNLDTIKEWLVRAHLEAGITLPTLASTHKERMEVLGPTVDGIFCLNNGFIQFDTSALSFIGDDVRQQYPDLKWQLCESTDCSLFVLFLLLTEVTSSISGSWLNPLPYASNLKVDGVSIAN